MLCVVEKSELSSENFKFGKFGPASRAWEISSHSSYFQQLFILQDSAPDLGVLSDVYPSPSLSPRLGEVCVWVQAYVSAYVHLYLICISVYISIYI